jgi:AraC-like DNA-binding protein
MCAARPARFEARKGRSRNLIYAKQPGALLLVPAGVSPPLRSLSDFELVVCTLACGNLENDLTLEALARESGYSPIHFSRMFRAATGHTPHNYVLHLRVERARQLLAEPSVSLAEIALECGFSSHSHMTRVFHQLVGMTPSAYRRTLRWLFERSLCPARDHLIVCSRR